jgi:hypothetical protein
VDGFKFVKLYEPELLVVAVREAPVFTSVAVTLAPETIAPEGSVTVPLICPVSAWPKTKDETTNRSARIASTRIMFVLIKLSPL